MIINTLNMEINTTYHTGHSHTIIKRYSQFDKLQRKLQRQLKAEGDTIITLPHLPPKYMSKSKSMSQSVVASRKDGLLMFLNLMVCILEGGVSDILQDVFWDFLNINLFINIMIMVIMYMILSKGKKVKYRESITGEM